MIKKIFLFSFLYIFSINAQIENIIKDLSEKKNNSISEKEASKGLKEALTIGVTKSCEKASSAAFEIFKMALRLNNEMRLEVLPKK